IRRNVPGRTQRRAGDVEAYPLSKRVQQVDESLDVKDPHKGYGIACTGAQRCKRDQCQHRRDEISVSDLIGKRPRHSGADDGADEQRHAQGAGGVVQQQRLERRTQRHGRKARRNVPPRDKNKHKKTSYELQTEELEVPHSHPPFRSQSTGLGQRRSQLASGSCLLHLSRPALSSFGSLRSWPTSAFNSRQEVFPSSRSRWAPMTWRSDS